MLNGIIFKEKNEKLFWQQWQKFICDNKVGPRYLKTNIESYILISKNNNLLYKDKSFVLIINNQSVACVFLPIERKNKKISMTFNSSYINAPLCLGRPNEKKVFKIIEEIAKENKVNKIMFAIDPLGLSGQNYNYLQEYGYFDTSILIYLIDLLLSEDLLNDCRRGHKCDIKKMLNDDNFKVFFMDRKNPDYKIHEAYRKMHYRCSGRVTRGKKTFEFQFTDLKSGNAVLFSLKYKQKNIAFIYFKYNFDKAVYASGVDDPAFQKFPIYHLLIFSAMEYLKKNGVRFISMGQPSSPSAQFDYFPNNKQLNIALFKRGFPGYFVNYFRGIKYFSQAVFENDAKKNIKKYKQSIIN